MSKQPFIDQLDQAITGMLADPDAPVSFTSVDASLAGMLSLARDLRELPGVDFKMRLRAELERKALMIMKPVQFREGFRTITPYVVCPTSDFIDFAKRVFGAVETEHTVTSPASFHAELRIGDSMLMVGVGPNRSMPTELILHVPNSDEVYERALAAGAISLVPMTEEHGERFGCVRDSAGNGWCISTNLGDNDVPENLHSLTPVLHPEGAAKFIEFLNPPSMPNNWPAMTGRMARSCGRRSGSEIPSSAFPIRETMNGLNRCPQCCICTCLMPMPSIIKRSVPARRRFTRLRTSFTAIGAAV